MAQLNAIRKCNPQREAPEPLEVLLLAGLESGEPIEVSEDYLRRKRADLMRQLTEAKHHNDQALDQEIQL